MAYSMTGLGAIRPKTNTKSWPRAVRLHLFATCGKADIVGLLSVQPSASTPRSEFAGR